MIHPQEDGGRGIGWRADSPRLDSPPNSLRQRAASTDQRGCRFGHVVATRGNPARAAAANGPSMRRFRATMPPPRIVARPGRALGARAGELRSVGAEDRHAHSIWTTPVREQIAERPKNAADRGREASRADARRRRGCRRRHAAPHQGTRTAAAALASSATLGIARTLTKAGTSERRARGLVSAHRAGLSRLPVRVLGAPSLRRNPAGCRCQRHCACWRSKGSAGSRTCTRRPARAMPLERCFRCSHRAPDRQSKRFQHSPIRRSKAMRQRPAPPVGSLDDDGAVGRRRDCL